MKKLTLILKLILRIKIIFKTPNKHDLVLFDKTSASDLSNCLSKYNFVGKKAIFLLYKLAEIIRIKNDKAN